MDFKDFKAGKDDEDRRFDKVLRVFLNDTSLSEIYKLIRKGLVKLNHKKAKPDTHISNGDIISIASFLLDNKKDDILQKNSPIIPDNLNIVFENQHLLIIDKPYGRIVHGTSDKKNTASSLDKDVLAYYEAKNNGASDSLSFRPGPLHRLDRNTSGLLVFSMSIEGARWFSEGIQNHTIHKKYYGLAEGKLAGMEKWQDKLSDSDKKTDSGFFTVKADENGLSAQTEVKPLSYGNYKGKPVTLVEYTIKTGRKHQIRAQSFLHGHTLLGDSAYNSELSIKGKREFYLQAFELEFPENNTLGLPAFIKIGLSSDFYDILDYCEIKNPGL